MWLVWLVVTVVAAQLVYYLFKRSRTPETPLAAGVDKMEAGDAIHFTSHDGDWRHNCVAITEEILISLFNERILHDHRFRKLRQRVVGLEDLAEKGKGSSFFSAIWKVLTMFVPGGGLRWVMLRDDEFDVKKHITSIKLYKDDEEVAHSEPQQGQCSKCADSELKKRLEDIISEFADSPLDNTLPLWKGLLIHYAPNCKALALRSHHAIADGFSFVNFLISATDEHYEKFHMSGPPPLSMNPSEKGQALIGNSVIGRLVFLSRMIRGMPGMLIRLGFPGPKAPSAHFVVKKVKDEDLKVRVAWLSPTISVDTVKEIAHALNATINDVLFAAVAAAFSAYDIEEKESETTSNTTNQTPTGKWRDIRALLPVGSAFAAERKIELINRFGLVNMPLPLDRVNQKGEHVEVEPLARLLELKRRMDEMKVQPDYFLCFYVAAFAGQTFPPVLLHMAAQQTSGQAAFLLTSVKGPTSKLYVRGHEMSEMVFFVPTRGFLPTGVSIFSYAGQISIGLGGDVSVQIKRPHRLLELMRKGVEDLALACKKL